MLFSNLKSLISISLDSMRGRHPTKKRKSSFDKMKSNLKVKTDTSKSPHFMNQFSIDSVDLVAKNIKKENLSEFGVRNEETESFLSTPNSIVSVTQENDINNNNNSQNEHNVSSTSALFENIPTEHSIDTESERFLENSICDEHLNQTDSNTIKLESANEIGERCNVINHFFLLDTEQSGAINLSAQCKLCNTLVRGSKKATSNFNRHMTVRE